MERELVALSEAIDEIACINEALAANFSQVASRLEHQGFTLGASPFREMSHRHAQAAVRVRARCASFIRHHG